MKLTTSKTCDESNAFVTLVFNLSTYITQKDELPHPVARVLVARLVVDPQYDAVVLQTRIRNDSKDTTHLSPRIRGRCVRHVARRVVLDLSSVERAVPTEMVGVHVGGIRRLRHLQPDQRRGIHRVSVQDGACGYALGNHGVHVVGDVGLHEVLKKTKTLVFRILVSDVFRTRSCASNTFRTLAESSCVDVRRLLLPRRVLGFLCETKPPSPWTPRRTHREDTKPRRTPQEPNNNPPCVYRYHGHQQALKVGNKIKGCF